MNYVAAFRTYTWNDGVAELARRFFAAFPAGRHVVFANEGRGSLGITEYEVVSHDDDTSSLGLPDYPEGNAHWYNVDYALYLLRRALPEYDYYVMSESDLAVNLPLEGLIVDMRAQELAMVVHELLPSMEPWHWNANAHASFDDPWRALCFFMAAKGETIDALYRLRLQHAAEHARGERPIWPFCEAFVPSALKLLGLDIGEIGTYANVENLRFRPRLALSDPRANRPGSMAHSVLPDDLFYAAVFREYPIMDVFLAESALSQALQGHDILAYGDGLLDRFGREGDHAAFQEVKARMSAAGRDFPAEKDVGFCKPAIVSSVSPWSRTQDPQREASGANGVVFHEDLAFHTGFEDGAWWLMDLLEDCDIDEVRIVNRVGHADRFRQFALETSVDGVGWTMRFVKLDLGVVSSDANAPFQVAFEAPARARYVRIRRLGQGFLHLRRVSVLGRSAA